MTRHHVLSIIAALFFLAILYVASGPAAAGTILSPSDAVVAIDLDPPNSNSSYPDAENPANAVDGMLNKYLNFGGPGSGFIVTPAAGASTIQSFQLTTANDAEGRDPTSFELWGTNDGIVSTDNSDGLGGENWTLIDSFELTGGFALPAARDTPGPVVPITNAGSYTSFKMQFPTLKGSTLFQVAEVSFFASNDGSGPDVLEAGDPALAVHLTADSLFPGAEGPASLIDQDANTKYLNFGRENAGFIVTPSSGPSTVKTFRITTANDAESRDPTTWELYGTNDAVVSEQNSQADAENWTLIDSGSIVLPTDRTTPGPFVQVDNDSMYASYRMVFPTIRDPDAGNADSMQIAEIQFFDTSIPEPSCAVLGLTCLVVGFGFRRNGRTNCLSRGRRLP